MYCAITVMQLPRISDTSTLLVVYSSLVLIEKVLGFVDHAVDIYHFSKSFLLGQYLFE